MKRPLLQVGLVYIGGIITAEYFPLPPIIPLTILGFLTVTAFLWSNVRAGLLYAMIFLAGLANLSLQKAVLSATDLRRLLLDSPKIVSVRGVLLETPIVRAPEEEDSARWFSRGRLEVESMRPDGGNWQPATGNIIISSRGQLTNLFAGQTVEVTGVIEPPPRATAEGLFDYRSYLARLGIYFQLRTSSEQDWQILASPPSPPLADRFRSWGQRALSLGLPAEDASVRLEWALTLGWKQALTEEVSEPFIRAATYHIFAVDGLRMAIIFGIFFGLLRAVDVPRGFIGLALLPVIWFYVALTGWPASAIRATVMLTIVIVGWVLQRPGELINSLFAAALIILAFQPQQLFQAGFQLSFFVVLCIILTVPTLHGWPAQWFAPDPLLPKALHGRWPPWIRVPTRYVWDVLVTSLAAWIGSLPLVAYYFHIVTPVSTPANLVAVPLCALVLMSNLASLLLAGWFQAAAIIFNQAGWFLMECIRVSSNWFAGWPMAYYYVKAPSMFTCGLYYGVLLVVVTGWLFKPAFRRLKIAFLGILVATWGVHTWHDFSFTRLTILPLNGGTAVFFDPPGTKDDLLINCGRSQDVQRVIKPFLRGQGLNRLAGLTITHGEARSMAGADELERGVPITHVYASSVSARSTDYRTFLAAADGKPGHLLRVNRGDEAQGWQVLHPDPSDRFPQADDNSLVLFTSVVGSRVLLLSDLGGPGQAALLKRNPRLQADIVISGLPNRGEPALNSLLEMVQPRLLVIADSDRPPQQRASPKLRERLEKKGVPVIYLRSAGAITFQFRDSDWRLYSMNGTNLSSHAMLTFRGNASAQAKTTGR